MTKRQKCTTGACTKRKKRNFVTSQLRVHNICIRSRKYGTFSSRTFDFEAEFRDMNIGCHKKMFKSSKSQQETYNCLVWHLGNTTWLPNSIISRNQRLHRHQQVSGHSHDTKLCIDFINELTSHGQPAPWDNCGISAVCPSHDFNDQLLWTEHFMCPRWQPSDIQKLAPGMEYKQTICFRTEQCTEITQYCDIHQCLADAGLIKSMFAQTN